MAHAEMKRPPIPEYVERLNNDHFVVNEAGKTVIYRETYDKALKRPVLERTTFADFKNLHMTKTVEAIKANGDPIDKPLGKAWIESPDRRQYTGGIVFKPGVAFDPTDSTQTEYNLWRGFAVKPIKGKWERMRVHIRDVLCSGDEVLMKYVLDYFANMLQNPAQPGQVAIVAKGPEGCGKGVVFRQLVQMFGQHGWQIFNAKHLVGNFNGHLRDVVCLFADEAFFAGDAKHISVLKGIITEPTLAVESKHANTVQSPNYIHLLMASNDDWVVPAGKHARRFCVLDVDPVCVGDDEYFDDLYSEMDNGGREAMLHDLLERDVSDFNPANFPRTEALVDQQIRSLTGMDKWWCDALLLGELPHSGKINQAGNVFDSLVAVEGEITIKALFKSYAEFCRQDRFQRQVSALTFAQKMRDYGRRVSRVNVELDHKRGPGFDVGTLENARGLFCKKVGFEIDFSTESPEDAATPADCGTMKF